MIEQAQIDDGARIYAELYALDDALDALEETIEKLQALGLSDVEILRCAQRSVPGNRGAVTAPAATRAVG